LKWRKRGILEPKRREARLLFKGEKRGKED